jgi:hypothetical protein
MIVNKISKVFLCLIVFLFSANIVFAQISGSGSGSQTGSSVSGSNSSCETKICNYLKVDSIPALVKTILSAILGIVGTLALAMFVYGGLTWMTSAGRQDAVSRGKGIITWATLGLIMVFFSYVLIKFVFEAIGVD